MPLFRHLLRNKQCILQRESNPGLWIAQATQKALVAFYRFKVRSCPVIFLSNKLVQK